MKRLILAVILPLGVLTIATVTAQPPKKKKPAPPPAATAPDAFVKEVQPLIAKYCLGCHTGTQAAGGFNLANDKTLTAVLKNRKVWERATQNVGAKTMPPSNMPQPTDAERLKILAVIDGAITKADCALNDPGRVTMRRLNRAEYNNTVRDLFGVTLRPADEFPSDDVGYGFDNIGDVLSLSPLLMEKYLSAAEKVAKAAVVAPEDRKLRPEKYSGDRIDGDGDDDGEMHFWGTVGRATLAHNFPAAGVYEIRLSAYGTQGGNEFVKMKLDLEGKEVRTFEVKAERQPETYSAKIEVGEAGRKQIGVSFLNDYFDANVPDPNRRDRNLFVTAIEVVPSANAPMVMNNLPESHLRIMTAPRPELPTEAQWNASARKILEPLAKRALRRPVRTEEMVRLLKVVQLARAEKLSFEKGIQLGIQALLVSPHFLYRVEPDAKAGTRRPLTDYELASRLSYFLWSSTPDDELLKLADAGKLSNPQILATQAKRMLKSPKASALGENFAGQWLQLRKLSVVTPDTTKFGNWNDRLRVAMRTETEMCFNYVVQNDRPILEFLDAPYTFWNEMLAQHYDNTTVKGNDFRKVTLSDNRRGGLLTQASILTLTSNPNRTSPVKRGKWVLENILNQPPPPPPPNVPELDKKDGKATTAQSVRQRLEEHRKNPACASCHERMDGIGFAFERFDALGQWRESDDGQAIDTTGALISGEKFKDARDLKALLMSKKGTFTRALTEKLLTYALGRGIESTDKCNIDAMAAEVAKNNYSFSSLVATIVQSKPFREKRSDSG